MVEKQKSHHRVEFYNVLHSRSDILLIANGRKPRTLFLDLFSERSCKAERKRVERKIEAAQAELKAAKQIIDNEKASLAAQGKPIPADYPTHGKTFETQEEALARLDLAQAEAVALERLIQKFAKEKQQEVEKLQKNSKPRGSSRLNHGKVVEIDNMTVNNNMIIDGPYEGMALDEYQTKIVKPYLRKQAQIQKRKMMRESQLSS